MVLKVAQRWSKRLKYVERAIEQHEEPGDSPDVQRLLFMRDVLERLGKNGMSSDESDEDDDGHPLFRVNYLYWRRDITSWLDRIDEDNRHLDTNPYVAHAGAQPVRRLRRDGEDSIENASQRKPVRMLPICLYDADWYARQGVTDELRRLNVRASDEEFLWLDVAPKTAVPRSSDTTWSSR